MYTVHETTSNGAFYPRIEGPFSCRIKNSVLHESVKARKEAEYLICEEMLQTAIDMVKINSVNSTPGEREIGIFLEQYLRKIPYFEAHPEQVIVRELKQDPLHGGMLWQFSLEKSPSPPEPCCSMDTRIR